MREKFGLRKLRNEVVLEQFRTMSKPVLVSKTSEVSGKLYIASEMGKMDKIGYDCVAISVNDMVAMGAEPLFFYDNISCVRPREDKLHSIEEGIAQGCKQADIQYAGSEVVELPDTYSLDQYDLVGFIVGLLSESERIGTAELNDGDVIIGLPSDGLHNSGYVTARKQLFLTKGTMDVYYNELENTLGDALLTQVRMYQKSIVQLKEEISIKSCAQVGDGGLDRALRILLHEKYGAVIKRNPDSIPALYEMIQRDGKLSDVQMRQTFNMGIGMLLIVSEEDSDRAVECLEETGEEPILLGLVETERELIRYL